VAEVSKAVRVMGEVQGVFFRAWTQGKARELGLSGWVRNAADGSVEAHVQGDEAKVAELIVALGHGPDQARVATVEVHDIAPEAVTSFEIRH
jgi:acylphosphatase